MRHAGHVVSTHGARPSRVRSSASACVNPHYRQRKMCSGCSGLYHPSGNRGKGFYRCLKGDRERKNNCAAGREKPVWRQLRAAFVSNYGQWGGWHRACISAAVCGWSRGLARENMIRSLSARKTNSGAVFPIALFWFLVFHSINARTVPERVNMCPGGGCTC